jgi:aminopeptidase
MLSKWAELLVGYCTEVKPGDKVLINLDVAASELARALVRQVLKADGEPHLRLEYEGYQQDILELASERYMAAEPALELAEMAQIDAFIRVRAPQNTRALQHGDKSRLARLAKKMSPVQRIRVDETRWVGSLYPTAALAQEAEMSLDAFETFVFEAMFLHCDDPVAEWRKLHDFQAELIARLSEARELRIVAEGTDLTLNVAGRTWINSDGHRNMPSGEVFTGPHEASANGTIYFDIPSSVGGSLVSGITLTFCDGQVISASAEVGDDLLQAQLALDEGARYLGELGIGTNFHIQRPIKQILFDEKIGGTVHLALGQAYKETGGTNQSALHWDMICDLRQGGAIYLDGELFQQDGKFIVAS